MKKVLKNALVIGAMALTLTSCSKVSSNYADKINAAAATSKTDDDYSYEKVINDLGKNWVLNLCGEGDFLGGIVSIKPTGAITWAQGCKTSEDYQKKMNEGKKIKTITVTFVAGVATHAEYSEIDYSSDSAK